MAFYCVVMLDIALELAEVDPTYEDMASKFFEHFIHIMDAINSAGQGEGQRCADLSPILSTTPPSVVITSYVLGAALKQGQTQFSLAE